MQEKEKEELQELIAHKDRLERLIANILNGEGYSKLKHIIKENVKAILSEKRLLISISFAAVIQTLKDNPQMVKLIQKMPSANDGGQYNDNNNHIIKFIEVNKDRIMYLAEKHYENLVEAWQIRLCLVPPLLTPILHYHCLRVHLHLQTYLIKVIPTE
ncbi:MAG: hypothetical protein M3297_04925 [Thermoproteota archaeon]|nr:hypothetical protein [Thermoproteota archaeon]